MVDKKCGVRLAASGLLALSLLAGTPVVQAAQADSAADSVTAASGEVPIPRTFSLRISTSFADLTALVNYGLSLPDPPPLPLPEDFHRTADRPGMSEVNRTGLVADLAKPTPRLASGRPDLNGPWKQARYGAAGPGPATAPPIHVTTNEPPPEPTPEQKAQAIGLATLLRPANQPVYKQSQHQVKQRDMWRRNLYTDPAYKCLPAGVPRISAPAYVVQNDQSFTLIYSARSDGNVWRYIPIGGEFKADMPATPYGQSVGHWEGDPLVVEVRNLDPTTWFGEFGLFHGPNVRVTERYRRVGGILVYQAKVEDPDLLAEPYYATARYNMPGEFLPLENERCVRPATDDVRTELFPGAFLPEGNLNSR